jgi:hypothetical protein
MASRDHNISFMDSLFWRGLLWKVFVSVADDTSTDHTGIACATLTLLFSICLQVSSHFGASIIL